MIESRQHTLEDGLAFDKEIILTNPDPPYTTYSYTYHLRQAGWHELQERLAGLLADHFFIITDATFPADIAEKMQKIIGTQVPCDLLTFAGGERAKTLLTVEQLGVQALEKGATRASVIIALGGGLAGNVAGLLAGILFRGIRFIHLPTTLLAMSDSCLSLKQGVNSCLGKNHFGLFKAPEFVWAELEFLRSLPAREIQSALCEMIKNILVICPEQFDEFAATLHSPASASNLSFYSDRQFVDFILLCIDAKNALMCHDALEKHQALGLEYGHTVGHAVELIQQGTLPHGLAIGMGMVVEATLSYFRGMLSRAGLDMHYILLNAINAPTCIPDEVATEDLLSVLAKDNKRGYLPSVAGHYAVVLLEAPGKIHRTQHTVLTQVSQQEMRLAIETCRYS